MGRFRKKQSQAATVDAVTPRTKSSSRPQTPGRWLGGKNDHQHEERKRVVMDKILESPQGSNNKRQLPKKSSKQKKPLTLSTKHEAVLKAINSDVLSPLSKNSASLAKLSNASSRGSQSTTNSQQPKRNKMKWFRKAISKSPNTSEVPQRGSSFTMSSSGKGTFTGKEVDLQKTQQTREPQKPVTPLQLQLWLGAVRQAIQPVVAEPTSAAAKASSSTNKQRSIKKSESTDPTTSVVSSKKSVSLQTPQRSSSYHTRSNNTGVYVDYSTYDEDADSVSSIDLLFKWLSCKDITVHRGKRLDSRGMAVDDMDSDDSWDVDAKPRRRILFSP